MQRVQGWTRLGSSPAMKPPVVAGKPSMSSRRHARRLRAAPADHRLSAAGGCESDSPAPCM